MRKAEEASGAVRAEGGTHVRMHTRTQAGSDVGTQTRGLAKRLLASALAAAALLSAAWAPTAMAGKQNDTLVWVGETELNTADTYYLAARELGIISLSNCDSLMFRDLDHASYQGLLATSWKWTDQLTLDLQLRQGVTFQNGKPFSSDDVVYTFQHLLSKEGRPAIAFPVEWIKSVEALGPYSVRFHLRKPTPMAFEYLSGMTPIYAKGTYDAAPEVTAPDGSKRHDWGAVRPICSGPYKITDMQPGRSVTLEKNPNYFKGGPKGTPSIGKIVYRTVADPQAQIAGLLTGDIDWAWSLNRDDAGKVAQMGNLTVASAPTMRINALSMDAAGRSGPNPFTDVRVRQAVNYAIDKAAIVKNMLGGGAQVLDSACYPSQVGCTADGVPRYPYDPAKAKALLAAAGYPNGFNIALYAYRDRPLVESMIGYLRAVGINIDLKYMQIATWNPQYNAGKMPMSFITWGSLGVNDASASASHYFSFTPEDYARDPELQKILSQADVSYDENQRKALYKQALTRIADQAYWAPLFSQVRYYAFSQDLAFKPTADEFPQFFAAHWK